VSNNGDTERQLEKMNVIENENQELKDRLAEFRNEQEILKAQKDRLKDVVVEISSIAKDQLQVLKGELDRVKDMLL